jgi:DNA replication and repair protein RecF
LRILELYIENFRNHIKTEILLNADLNVFFGLNGSGKTSILEAVSVNSLSKSFQSVNDSSLVQKNQNKFKTSFVSLSDVEVPYKVNVEYRTGTRKKIYGSYGDNLNPKDIIGIVPLVILSPDHKSLTYGSPQDKRQFLDMVLSQSGKQYVDEILKYKKYLKQRNSILAKYRIDNTINKEYFDILSDMFINSAVEIIFKRMNFIRDFKKYFLETFSRVSINHETPDIEYNPDTIGSELVQKKSDIHELLKRKQQSVSNHELKRGLSLFGPHRDDLTFFINELDSKTSASQGQHKSLLISIKLAEFSYLKNILNETPVLLFDDIFSELDEERSNSVFQLVMESSAQTLVTLTNAERFSNRIRQNSGFFEVIAGKVLRNDAV